MYENKQKLSQDVAAQLELKASDSKPDLSRDLNKSKDQAALIWKGKLFQRIEGKAQKKQGRLYFWDLHWEHLGGPSD